MFTNNYFLGLGVLALLALARATPVHGVEITVNCSRAAGKIRALQGGNDGPIQFGGLIDLSASYREIGVPFARLHDCRWPSGDVVDMHVVFPNPAADPSLAGSYDFGKTDACIDAVLKTGSKVIYRLGESIEHTPRKYFVNPPANYDRWAQQCVGIIRHYNEGWADGARDGIAYWEIWNEPENRPSCFTGTDDDYFRLYATAARAIKSRWPELKVGGPAVGYTGQVVDGRFKAGEFLVKFLAYCRDNSLPLDFCSWHLYGNDPNEYAVRARGIRDLLNQYGFQKTEMQLNEWNYLPDNRWLALDLSTQGAVREKYFARMTGAESAAFIAGVLIVLQDSPVDMANFFAMNTQPLGLFSEHGSPRRNFYAFKAFRGLLDTPSRVEVKGSSPRLFACAGMNDDHSQVGVLLSNLDAANGNISMQMQNLPWKGEGICEAFVTDSDHDFAHRVEGKVIADGGRITISLPAPATCLVIIRQRETSPAK
ncbi:MAG TPA: hypothetical protein VFE47_04390 [Tepidisphaeraceae bacterium]|jgi:hypothetical protein|nr:hypothetical protein [Tepidisphaeraceae bacterium]